MTIRKRLSRTNTRILLFALLSLLVIGVFIIEIFDRNTRKKDPELWSQLLYRKRQAKSQYGFFYKTASGDAVFRFLCYHQ